jgi:hypothetical protein
LIYLVALGLAIAACILISLPSKDSHYFFKGAKVLAGLAGLAIVILDTIILFTVNSSPGASSPGASSSGAFSLLPAVILLLVFAFFCKDSTAARDTYKDDIASSIIQKPETSNNEQEPEKPGSGPPENEQEPGKPPGPPGGKRGYSKGPESSKAAASA